LGGGQVRNSCFSGNLQAAPAAELPRPSQLSSAVLSRPSPPLPWGSAFPPGQRGLAGKEAAAPGAGIPLTPAPLETGETIPQGHLGSGLDAVCFTAPTIGWASAAREHAPRETELLREPYVSWLPRGRHRLLGFVILSIKPTRGETLPRRCKQVQLE